MTLSDLLHATFLQRARVLTGSAYLDKDVTWCVPESALRFDNYIMPGLLLLVEEDSLDHLAKNPDEVDGYVNKLVACGVSGVVCFSDGDTSIEPAQKVLARFNEEKIPVVQMPASTNVVSFMKRFVAAFSSNEADVFRYHEWLRNLTFGASFGGDETAARQYGYNPDFCYYCMVIEPRGEKDVSIVESEMDATSVLTYVTKRFSAEEVSALSFVEKSRTVIAFIPWVDEDDTQILRKSLIDMATYDLKTVSSRKWRISVGSCARSLSEFHDSYLGALRTADVIKALDVHEKVSFYDDWYMHMLLLKEPKAELKAHMEHTLSPILDSPDLLDTLTNYLVFGESLKVTSEKMFIHVNTLKYRLRRISELLGVDLKDPNVRFRLRMAITIERFLRKQP